MTLFRRCIGIILKPGAGTGLKAGWIVKAAGLQGLCVNTVIELVSTGNYTQRRNAEGKKKKKSILIKIFED